MKRFLSALTAALLVSVAAAEPADPVRGQAIAEEICIACHGADGNSAVEIYPRLAGQHYEYLVKNTKDIRDGVRAWGLAGAMVPMVETMTDQDILDVSAFMSRQLGLAGEADVKGNLEAGRKIYRGGIKAQGVPACMSCHSPNGAGMPAASTAKDGIVAFPRLSGQHKDFVLEQMNAFRDGSRTHPMMDTIAKNLTDQQIEDVANYIQGLY